MWCGHIHHNMTAVDNPASRELGYCPCCGYRTLPEGPPGSGERCPVCHWVDDATQFKDPESVTETNAVSLAVARENFAECGACRPKFVEETRLPGDESRDPNWPYE